MEAAIVICLFFLFGTCISSCGANLEEDGNTLLQFIDFFHHSRPLNWNESSEICLSWTGVICNRDLSGVVALRLPGVGLQGQIPWGTLGRLSQIKVLSLRNNGISGYLPSDFSKLSSLSYLYLQSNKLYGPLPDFFLCKNLMAIDLSNNFFNGRIDASFSNLIHLTYLNIANNYFSGEIPDMNFPNLTQLNMKNNHLIGVVPKSLRKFPVSVFYGNNLTLEIEKSPPLTHAIPPTPPHVQRNHPKFRNTGKLSEIAVLGIVISAGILGFVGFCFLLFVWILKRRVENGVSVKKFHKRDMSPEKGTSGSHDDGNKMVFFEGCTYVFDLEDLLRASAEILGKGTFGTSYRATLEDANMVAVKRLKEVGVGKREFEQRMEMVGRIKHVNVVGLRAYFYSKDEKLVVHDYYPQGSVFSMLHGENRIPLDWEARMRVAVGAAKGIARIHSENGGKLVHGNIKASNIFINSEQYGCISDVGLTAVMNPLARPVSRAAGYRAPEVDDTRKPSQPSDVYSFGVVLLELLTGKCPIHKTGGDEIVHLVRWVNSVVREEWTGEVFDIALVRSLSNIEEQLVEMLQIALACVGTVAEERPKMEEIVKMIEDVRVAKSEIRYT